MPIGESKENYLTAILNLSRQKEAVHAIDIAEYMGYSKPSVSVALKELKQQSLIFINNEHHILLTREGMEIAKDTDKKRKFFVSLLILLGIDQDVAQEEAHKLEHIISDETFYKMEAYFCKSGLNCLICEDDN